jgi:putative ABC transport system permease protein
MNLRLALRTLRRAPAFTVATILTLALGVGANTGAFSAVYALLLKPLPYPDPHRLVALYETTVDGKPRDVGQANLLDWRARTTLFEAMSAYRPRSFGLTRHPQEPVTVIQTGMVMADFFRVVAIPPALGRTFREDEEIADAPVIVLTDRLWRKLFDADPAIVGRSVLINEEPHTIIGVMPAGFEYPMSELPDAFLPLTRARYGHIRLGQLSAAARLKPGITLAAANAELDSVAARLSREYPTTNAGRTAALKPLEDTIAGARRGPLYLLLAATSLLLLIACANVAGLMLARWLARSHEIAIRIALGAGLRDLLRQFLAESALLSFCGTVCGLAAATAVLRVVPVFVPGADLAPPLHLDASAFFAALVLATAVTFTLAIAPVLLLRRTDLNGVIKAGTHRVRAALAATQVALSLVLLLSAGLLFRSFLHVISIDPGFDSAHALRFGIGLPEKRYATESALIDFHRNLLTRLSTLPGVESAGAAQYLPLLGVSSIGGLFQITGSAIPRPQWPRAWTNVATPGYFAAMRIPILQGRDFSWQDDPLTNPGVAIVNQTFVRTYLRDRRAIGTRIDLNWDRAAQWDIIGVTADALQVSLDREPVPQIYLSMTQIGADGCIYVLRGHPDARAVAAAVSEQDPRLERISPVPLQLTVERSLSRRAIAIRLVGAFGVLALLLTAVGLYGVLAFRAASRAREMAIRMALGATATHVRGLIFTEALALAAAGTLAGLVVFWMVRGFLQSQLYGVGPADPIAISAAVILILLVALAAAAAPSGRAVRSQPMNLLRER